MEVKYSFNSKKNKKELLLRLSLAAIGVNIVDIYPVIAGSIVDEGQESAKTKEDIFGRSLNVGVDEPSPVHLLNASPDLRLRKKYNLNFINMSYAVGESDAEKDEKKRYEDGTLLYWVSKSHYASFNRLPPVEGTPVLVAKNVDAYQAENLEYGSAHKQWLFLRRAYTADLTDTDNTNGELCLKYLDIASNSLVKDRAAWDNSVGDTVIVGVVVGSLKKLPRHVLPVKKLG